MLYHKTFWKFTYVTENLWDRVPYAITVLYTVLKEWWTPDKLFKRNVKLKILHPYILWKNVMNSTCFVFTCAVTTRLVVTRKLRLDESIYLQKVSIVCTQQCVYLWVYEFQKKIVRIFTLWYYWHPYNSDSLSLQKLVRIVRFL